MGNGGSIPTPLARVHSLPLVDTTVHCSEALQQLNLIFMITSSLEVGIAVIRVIARVDIIFVLKETER